MENSPQVGQGRISHGIGYQTVVVKGDLDAVGCSLFRVGFVFPKPLSPKHRGTFLPLQHAATLIFSVDWGLNANPNTTSGTWKFNLWGTSVHH